MAAAIRSGLLFAVAVVCNACDSQPSYYSGSLDFTFERNTVLVRTTLNETGPFTLLIDTGSDPSVIDTRVADELTWPVVPIGSAGDGAGGNAANVFILPPLSVQFGSTEPQRKLFLATDLSSISDRIGQPIHGILGYNVLSGKHVTIDFPNRQVIFAAADRQADFTAAMVVDSRDPMPVVNRLLAVNGRMLSAAIDTGFNGGLLLTTTGLKALGRYPVSATHCKQSVAYGGFVSRCAIEVTSVEIAGRPITGIDVVYDPTAPVVPGEAAAKIGNALLADFVVTFDYDTSQFELRRAEDRADHRAAAVTEPIFASRTANTPRESLRRPDGG